MKAYIAGPMRGIPKFNFPLFYSVEEELMRHDDGKVHVTQVFNPARHDVQVYPDIFLWEGFEAGDIDLCPKFSFTQAIRWDLARVLEADFIVMLPEWEHSSGATLEYDVAVNCGLEVRVWGDVDALH